MPGYFRKLEGVPPYPGKCGLCSLTHHEEINYFIDTSYNTEIEGQFYICNRCFDSLVIVSQKYLPVGLFNDQKAEYLKNVESDLIELQNLRRAKVILQNQFGLDLEDLFKYQDIRPELESTQRDYEEAESDLIKTRALVEASKRILSQQQESMAAAEQQLIEKNAEINQLISDSLTTVLDRRGRADLVAILLNNELPERTEPAPDDGEQQAFEFSGESDAELSFAD